MAKIQCPNLNDSKWKALVSKIGQLDAYRAYIRNDYEIPDAANFQQTTRGVDYVLSVYKMLGNANAEKWFNRLYKKGYKEAFYSKIIDTFKIRKPQSDLLKEWMEENNPDSIEDMVIWFLSDYSYTIEINSADENREDYIKEGEYRNGEKYYRVLNQSDSELGTFTTREQAEEFLRSLYREPSSFYKRLTVPGGTNYRENEISSPDITPSIKGHAQFSTDKGIGWFRSDDLAISPMKVQATEEQMKSLAAKGTRRILEVQSDLFQKGRENKDLVTKAKPSGEFINPNEQSFSIEDENGTTFYTYDTYHDEGFGPQLKKEYYPKKGQIEREVHISIEEYNEAYEKKYGKQKNLQELRQNDFLQLLNKDNNWVAFFVKSIIQDSAKKGYEKVLFPSGNTANKIQGHQIVEEFIETKKKYLAELESGIWQISAIDGSGRMGQYSSKEEAEIELRRMEVELGEGKYKGKMELVKKDNSIEIEQIKREIRDVESGSAAFVSINKFYESTIFNILKKRGYNPVRITDDTNYLNWFNHMKSNGIIEVKC